MLTNATAALVKVNAFPIEDAVGWSSISEIVDRMKGFAFRHPTICRKCYGVDCVRVVKKAIEATNDGHFDGLCLDCMDRSIPKGNDLDDEYWRINAIINYRWDTQCRVKHNQYSWYVSWCGSDDTRQQLLKSASGTYD